MEKKSALSSMTIEDAKWRTESDLRTLMEADAIKKDPKRMKAVQALAKSKLLDLAGIAAESGEVKS